MIDLDEIMCSWKSRRRTKEIRSRSKAAHDHDLTHDHSFFANERSGKKKPITMNTCCRRQRARKVGRHEVERERQTDRQTDRQTEVQRERQADRQKKTDRYTDRD